MTQLVEHNGKQYVRIDASDIDFSRAEKAQKLTDVYAIQVKQGTQQIITRLGEHVETVKTAKAGDWIVFNIGNVNPKSIPGYDSMTPEEQVLACAERAEAYVPPAGSFDNSYTLGDAVGKGRYAKTCSDPRIAVTIPFNFVINAPWGEDMFVRAGGVIINNGPNDTYGIEKEAFASTYGAPGATKVFEETHAVQVLSRKPLVPPAVFVNNTTEYENAAASIIEKQ